MAFVTKLLVRQAQPRVTNDAYSFFVNKELGEYTLVDVDRLIASHKRLNFQYINYN